MNLIRPGTKRRQHGRFAEIISDRRRVLAIVLPSLISLPVSVTLASPNISCWDAASEFNDSVNPDATNPSGVWSYGWKKSLTDKFLLATTPLNDPPDIFGWSSASGFPFICHVSRSVPVLTHGPNRAILPAHVLSMHPAVNGEYAVLRFTAPGEGTYKVSGRFYALDDNDTGTTTDVWILRNNQQTPAFSGRVDY
ncbi:MAG TPA: hypothetical protein VGF73_06075, partial [Chthoniobacterales bacterium]